MKHKFWIYLLISAAVAFVPVRAFEPLDAIGLETLGGLLIMGALVLGWPGFSVWLGVQAGKEIKKLWLLPILYSAMMVLVFPYYRALQMSLLYAGLVLLVGVIAMVGTRLAG